MIRTVDTVASMLRTAHYLGPIRRGQAYQDEAGIIVFASPTARNLPNTWLEITRWCIITDLKNAGSSQWARFRRVLLSETDATTLVSYSDPSVGHTGALYRACNWWWAPTWHRLRPPPSGNGSWATGGGRSGIKDRWVFPLRPDPARVTILRAQDEAALRRYPEAIYREPGGADYKAFMARAA